jgi:hypothetical protein
VFLLGELLLVPDWRISARKRHNRVLASFNNDSAQFFQRAGRRGDKAQIFREMQIVSGTLKLGKIPLTVNVLNP